MSEQPFSFRCGMVSIVGRPNTGKSTLVNYILEEKIAIVSSVPQTTRQQIRGIYNDKRGQIIFIDTPGVHVGQDKLDKIMNLSSFHSAQEADCIVHLVDTRKSAGPEEKMVVDRLSKLNIPIILGLNKIDAESLSTAGSKSRGANLKGKYISDYINLWQEAKGRPVTEIENFILLPLSGKTGFNIDKLLELIFERLPTGEALYPQDIISDTPQKMVIADIIREKLLYLMREEVPHSLGVIINELALRKNKLLYVYATIFVERESQKEIVIGKKGEILKKIGTQARRELEGLLEQKVFLELHVKAEKKWRENNALLEEMGYGFNIQK